MEGENGRQNSKENKVFPKSPQELAAQVESVYGISLESTRYPEGKTLDRLYQEMKNYVKELLESGISDEKLEEELIRLYEQGKQSGIYSPLEGKGYLAELRNWRRNYEKR